MTREEDARRCAEIAARHQSVPPSLYVCQCDHTHPPSAAWCYLCEYPVRDPGPQDGA